MSTQPLTAAKFREFDSNGNPLAGGLLYSYAAGTTTPQATYTTRAGDVANANPVVLDASGRADVWLTPGVGYKFVLNDAQGNLQYTVDNYPSPASSSASTDGSGTDPGGRLTISSGVSVPTSDVTGATTIYYVPHESTKVPLYDGVSAWTLFDIGVGLSQTTGDTTKSPGAVAASSNYDLFIWNDSGVPRLSRGPAWTSDTARGTGAGTTELARVGGRYVNANSISNGPAAQCGLYVGTVHSDASSQINDSQAKRHVWNASNRVRRVLRRGEVAASWTYSVAAWRQANANAANQMDFVVGLQEDSVNARLTALATTNAATGIVGLAMGLDSTTVPAIAGLADESFVDAGVSYTSLLATYEDVLLGRHFLAWLEFGTGANTQTWFSLGPTTSRGGMQGDLLG